jgi:hypothetical protein
MKYPLVVEEPVIEYVLIALRELLATTPWR